MKLETHLDAEAPTVRGGGAQLVRVLVNLLTNALEAMNGHGRLTVTTAHVHLDQPPRRYDAVNPGTYVRLDITDTGCGIAAEVRDRIFDPFVSTKTADKRRGSGLGLSVVHSIVQDHDGYVDFDSEVGKGTTFHLFLPVVRETPGIALPTEALPRGHGERVLVVDDDSLQLRVVSTALAQLGYVVATAASGEEAVAAVSVEPPDLVILDMVMPGIDGTETLLRLRQRRPDQRVLILSAYADIDRVAAAVALGVSDVLAKPLHIQTLGHAVHAALQPQSVPTSELLTE